MTRTELWGGCTQCVHGTGAGLGGLRGHSGSPRQALLQCRTSGVLLRQGRTLGNTAPGETASPPLPCRHPCFARTHWDFLVFAEEQGRPCGGWLSPHRLPGELFWGLASHLAPEAALSVWETGVVCPES